MIAPCHHVIKFSVATIYILCLDCIAKIFLAIRVSCSLIPVQFALNLLHYHHHPLNASNPLVGLREYKVANSIRETIT